MTLYTKHIRCQLDTNKNNKYSRTVLQIDNDQREKLRMLYGPGIRGQRLLIETGRFIEQNTTLGYADSSPSTKTAQQPPLAAQENITLPFEPRHINTTFGGLHTHTSAATRFQGPEATTHSNPKAVSKTRALPHSASSNLTLI